MKNPTVAVVVLNYKGWKDSVTCVHSIFNQTYESFHILLIENGSHDDSVHELSKLRDQRLTFIQNEVNLGFAGGVNQGISWAMDEGYDAVALLNNDAHAEPDWLEHLVKTMQKTGADAVTSLMLHADGKHIGDAGDFYTTWGIPMLRSESQPKAQAPESGFVFGATGGATLYKTSLFESIGLFDNALFAYNEDVDIDWRAQLAGHKIYYERNAVVYHKQSATSKKMPGFTTVQVFRNLPVVFIKNVPFPMVVPMFFRFTLIYWAFFGYKIIRGQGLPALKGIIKGIGLWPHAIRARRAVQKNKRVSNAYIRSLLYKGLPLRSVRRLKHFLRHPFSRTAGMNDS